MVVWSNVECSWWSNLPSNWLGKRNNILECLFIIDLSLSPQTNAYRHTLSYMCVQIYLYITCTCTCTNSELCNQLWYPAATPFHLFIYLICQQQKMIGEVLPPLLLFSEGNIELLVDLLSIFFQVNIPHSEQQPKIRIRGGAIEIFSPLSWK